MELAPGGTFAAEVLRRRMPGRAVPIRRAIPPESPCLAAHFRGARHDRGGVDNGPGAPGQAEGSAGRADDHDARARLFGLAAATAGAEELVPAATRAEPVGLAVALRAHRPLAFDGHRADRIGD